MFPRLEEKARWAGRLSQLMPSTWASFSSNRGFAILNEETWLVQPPVKSKT